MRRYLSVAAKAKSVSRVRGTRDLLVDDTQQHREVLDVLKCTVDRYGFRAIQTPLLEYTDLFSRSLGDGSDIVMKEMYTFKDDSGKSVTLRPEGTAGIMRALVSNNLMFSLPHKVSYSGSMFRYERPQRGRYREFQQFGVEFVGSTGPSVDTEVIAMAADALDALGIKHKVVLELNSLGDVAQGTDSHWKPSSQNSGTNSHPTASTVLSEEVFFESWTRRVRSTRRLLLMHHN